MSTASEVSEWLWEHILVHSFRNSCLKSINLFTFRPINYIYKRGNNIQSSYTCSLVASLLKGLLLFFKKNKIVFEILQLPFYFCDTGKSFGTTHICVAANISGLCIILDENSSVCRWFLGASVYLAELWLSGFGGGRAPAVYFRMGSWTSLGGWGL